MSAIENLTASSSNAEENPATAIGSQRDDPAQAPAKYKRRRKKEKDFKPEYDIPGVHKIVLSEDTQNAVGCSAGEAVTAEKPWITIDKDAIIEHLEAHPGTSEFLEVKEQVMQLPSVDVLIGYIPDESKDFDEFYLCVTKEATQTVNETIEKVKKIQEDKLRNAVNKKVKHWKSLGSEVEVDEGMMKRNRNLIEVEIESKYPILPFKVHFRAVKTEDLRDAYMELTPTDECLSTIYRRRVDASVQVTPTTKSNEAQTICTYPSNAYTQYEYEPPEIEDLETLKSAGEFIRGKEDSICDILRVNGSLDLYSNDYEKLVINPQHCVKTDDKAPSKEYICFIDMNLCQQKMISALTWHPMWTGCVVISYVTTAPSLYLTSKITTDEVNAAVHDTHPILFWSFDDNLKPKLVLETPRPVYAISCCPYNENLIIGGCINGQILIWDITNKLNLVEKEEIISIKQENYRIYMFSLMNWMKNIFDLARVRPAALSDLKYSHRGSVNHISWMSPFHTVSNTGKLFQNPEDSEQQSLQFISSAEDGTIMIWDLLKKLAQTPGGFKGMRKVRRLKKRPSALSVLESPFRQLHLKLRPIYRINLVHPSESRVLGICSSYFYFYKTHYETVGNYRTSKLNERLIYHPELHTYDSIPKQQFYIGTMEGDFLHGTWEGQEFDSGEIVNFEDNQATSFGKYHDGPIISVDYSTSNNIILTVGGRIFALWRDDFLNRPVLWRKSSSIYTDGNFFNFEQASLKLIRIDGYLELWVLFYKSKSYVDLFLASNGPVTTVTAHPRKIKQNVFALADYRGCLRMFYSKHASIPIITARQESMSMFITKEIERKKEFFQWQSDWNKRQEEIRQSKEKLEIKEAAKVFERAKPKHKNVKVEKVTPGQRYFQAVQEQRRVNEQERIKTIILTKKQLDTEELLKKKEPLRKLEEENEEKKRKQKLKLKESDRIFKDTVAMLFPDVVKSKPLPPPNPYQDIYEDGTKKDVYDFFKQLAIEAQDFIEENPFSCRFDWKSTLMAGRQRRKKLDNLGGKKEHWRRYAELKKEKDVKCGKSQQEIAIGEIASVGSGINTML